MRSSCLRLGKFPKKGPIASLAFFKGRHTPDVFDDEVRQQSPQAPAPAPSRVAAASSSPAEARRLELTDNSRGPRMELLWWFLGNLKFGGAPFVTSKTFSTSVPCMALFFEACSLWPLQMNAPELPWRRDASSRGSLTTFPEQPSGLQSHGGFGVHGGGHGCTTPPCIGICKLGCAEKANAVLKPVLKGMKDQMVKLTAVVDRASATVDQRNTARVDIRLP